MSKFNTILMIFLLGSGNVVMSRPLSMVQAHIIRTITGAVVTCGLTLQYLELEKIKLINIEAAKLNLEERKLAFEREKFNEENKRICSEIHRKAESNIVLDSLYQVVGATKNGLKCVAKSVGLC